MGWTKDTNTGKGSDAAPLLHGWMTPTKEKRKRKQKHQKEALLEWACRPMFGLREPCALCGNAGRASESFRVFLPRESCVDTGTALPGHEINPCMGKTVGPPSRQDRPRRGWWAGVVRVPPSPAPNQRSSRLFLLPHHALLSCLQASACPPRHAQGTHPPWFLYA